MEIAGLWSWAGEAEGGLVPLSLCSPSGWVLNWLKKGVEKVVPQPVRGGLEGPAQVLQGLGAGGRWGKGWRGGGKSAPGFSAHVCLCVCLSQQAGAEILGHCSPGDSGTSRRRDGFTGVELRRGGVLSWVAWEALGGLLLLTTFLSLADGPNEALSG